MFQIATSSSELLMWPYVAPIQLDSSILNSFSLTSHFWL